MTRSSYHKELKRKARGVRASFCVVPVENQTLKSLESVLSVEDSRASCVDLS